MVRTITGTTDAAPVVMESDVHMSGNLRKSIILLDGGSDCFLFNHTHYSLLFDVRPHSSAVSGIGGDTGMRITRSGNIIFMGNVLTDVLYSPSVDKSVLSEALLCSIFGYKIVKENKSCTISNHINNTSYTLELDMHSMQYILPLSLFDVNYEVHATNLASVRPSNLKTLWHGRFGHAYMGLIVIMARSRTYADRGLKLPDALLKADPNEDLCDACALGKPTFSFAFVEQYRSRIKGKLWYFDVSGGGKFNPVSRIQKSVCVYVCRLVLAYVFCVLYNESER
jgi:hypothetical protein